MPARRRFPFPFSSLPVGSFTAHLPDVLRSDDKDRRTIRADLIKDATFHANLKNTRSLIGYLNRHHNLSPPILPSLSASSWSFYGEVVLKISERASSHPVRPAGVRKRGVARAKLQPQRIIACVAQGRKQPNNPHNKAGSTNNRSRSSDERPLCWLAGWDRLRKGEKPSFQP